jgi:two-component system chemotaxis sensor kinase CheA
MKIDLSQFRQAFLQESADHICSMETGLLALRSSPADVELLNAIFRSAHSIKGGAGSFGLTNLVRFTHSLENLLDRLRSLEMQATPEVIDVLLKSVDVLRGLLDANADTAMPEDALKLDACIGTMLVNVQVPGLAIAEQEMPPLRDQLQTIRLYQVDFLPRLDLFSSGTNPIMLLRSLASLGTVRSCHLHRGQLPALADLDPSLCYLGWTMELCSACAEEQLREVFEFVEHLAEIRISCVDSVERSGGQLELSSPPPSLALEPASGGAMEQSRQKTVIKKPDAGGESGSIRVAIEKVDRLIDLVGELVIAHVMTAQMVEDFEPSCLPKLREAVAAMERNTRELHERVMAVRMLPVGTLSQRYARTVYDIAQSTGKQLQLELNGEETEIDKSMLELLGDPLTHLVRNAADHGIEMPAIRRASGKPEEGVIALKAFHRSGRIVIEISDDGAGIDTAKVRSKAIERGLIGPDSQLSGEQLQMLIFEPGFSTREEISDLSGRGVGMDVVKRNVHRLNGTVALTSEKGHGSTITIELPLTLAILEGLLVRVGDRTLVLPLLSVIETVPIRDQQIIRVAQQGDVFVLREESIPLLHLSRFLALSQEAALPNRAFEMDGNRRLAVIVEAGNRKIGLLVDELLGQQQVVVKSLERHLHRIEGLMGATILGDGRVAPIIDVNDIGDMNLFSPNIQAESTPLLLSSPQTFGLAEAQI